MPKDSELREAPGRHALARGHRLLHPNFVLRVAGEPCAPWLRLHDGAVAASLARMQRLREQIAALTPSVCGLLEQAIHAAGEDREARRTLLAAKRAVFNGRPLKPDAAALPQLAELGELARQLADAEGQFADLFEAEMARSVERLRAAAADAPALMGGIHYTNPTLYALAERWVRDGTASDARSARRLQATMLDFAMRAAFKTSPLSSFTPVVVGTWAGDAGAMPGLGTRAMRTRARINHSFMLHALEGVWRDPASLGDQFPLVLNPTIRREAGMLYWQQLDRSAARHGIFWGTSHPQRKAPLSAPLSAFLATAAHMEAPLTLACVTQALERALPPQHAPEARQFVDAMLALNVLHPVWTRYQQDDLLADAIRLAAPAGEALAPAGVELQALARQYEQADLERRTVLRRHIEAAAERMRGPGAKSDGVSAPVFFEDCSLDGPRLRDDPARWASVMDSLETWLALQPLFDRQCARESWLAAQFIAAYGASGDCHDIEAFLNGLDPDAVPADALSDLRQEFLDRILGAGEGVAEVRLDAVWCRALARRMPAALRRRGVSQVFFGQRSGPEGFVVNRTYAGSSTMMSRFLDQLTEAELGPVRDYLAQRPDNGRYLALPDVFGFNGNLHPRLADGEVLMTGARPGRPGVASHRLADLHLVYNAATDRLDVRDPAGVTHDLYYFGFLQARNLPPPHRLLARNVCAAQELWEALGGRRYLPRVSLGGVVLSRRTWIVPPADLPDPRGAGSAFALALHTLRGKLGLPADVFVRVVQEGERLSKPLYVHLDSPLHLRQLAAALRGRHSPLTIQEALPAPGTGTVTLNGREHTAEIQIELTLRGEAP